ncbi:MAG: hypothetical protein ACYSVY_24180 [Planctomycetota bacterium]|jgi:hypothetical protein
MCHWKRATCSYRRIALCVLTAALIGLAGCKTSKRTGSHRPLPPKPRPIQPAPPDARTDALVLNVSAAPRDTNGNGYPDLIHATAHLFDRRYAPAIREDGAFVFLLFAPGDAARPDAEPIRSWRYEGEALKKASWQSAFGDCYVFRLNLLDAGTDVLDISMADVLCLFEPADGRPPTYAGQVATIQIGRRVLVPQLRWKESSGSSRPDVGLSATLQPLR